MRVSAVARSLACALATLVFALIPVADGAAQMSNEVCLGCHGADGFTVPGADKKAAPAARGAGPLREKRARQIRVRNVPCGRHRRSPRPQGAPEGRLQQLPCGAEGPVPDLGARQGGGREGQPEGRDLRELPQRARRPAAQVGGEASSRSSGTAAAATRRTTRATPTPITGRSASLGFSYTAKCFDCHGSHDDPARQAIRPPRCTRTTASRPARSATPMRRRGS